MMYLPRICEHCLNPSCVASCPSGAMYKREEDGIVLVDQEACRSWRFCVSGCPYKKVYFNWSTGKAEKCNSLLPADRGRPADRLLGDLRRAPPLPRDRPDRRRPRRGGGLGRRRARPARRPARPLPRPGRPRGARAGPARRDPRRLDRGRAPLARLRDVQALAGRAAAAPRVPDAADGLVRAAALAGREHGRGGAAASRPRRVFADRRGDADPGRVPGRASSPPATPSRCAARSAGWRRCARFMRGRERRRARATRRSPATSGWSPPSSRRCSGWSRSATTTTAT